MQEHRNVKPGLLAMPLVMFAAATHAQPASERGPFFISLEGLFAYQGGADLEGGNSFSVERTYLETGFIYRFDDATFAGLTLSGGRNDYSFDTPAAAPWGTIEDNAISAIFRTRTGSMSWFVAPSLRYDFEKGADRADAETYGVFAGASWMLNDRLTIGPAFGLFTEIGDGSATAFPALLIDWDIAEKWNLSTGPTIGASRGPGLTLSYAVTDVVNLGLTGRLEETRFRLDDDGPAPNGIGEDRSFPLVVSIGYAPGPWASVNAFAGLELGGTLRLEDSAGVIVSEQDYDPAPIFGLQARLAF